MARKKVTKDEFREVKCSGCGRYTKKVDSRVLNWFCSNCVCNGNFLRVKNGKEPIIPESSYKKGNKVITINNKKFHIDGLSHKMGKTTYYMATEIDGDNIPVILSDYSILKKL